MRLRESETDLKMLLALKVEEEATSPEMWPASRSLKRRRNGSSSRASKRIRPASTSILGPPTAQTVR